jgi:hypothetical protein
LAAAVASLAVHPIERLRFVARSGWAGPADLGVEAAFALAELAEREPAALLLACRRLLERNPACGPLWWVSARLLCGGDPYAEASRCAEALEDDPTEERLEEALEGRRAVHHGGVAEVASADVVVIRTDALGPTGMVVDPDDEGLMHAAVELGAQMWAVAGVGRVLPPRLWEALRGRLRIRPEPARTAASAWFEPTSPTVGVVELGPIARVAGPAGLGDFTSAQAACDCPEPPELVAHW